MEERQAGQWPQKKKNKRADLDDVFREKVKEVCPHAELKPALHLPMGGGVFKDICKKVHEEVPKTGVEMVDLLVMVVNANECIVKISNKKGKGPWPEWQKQEEDDTFRGLKLLQERARHILIVAGASGEVWRGARWNPDHAKWNNYMHLYRGCIRRFGNVAMPPLHESDAMYKSMTISREDFTHFDDTAATRNGFGDAVAGWIRRALHGDPTMYSADVAPPSEWAQLMLEDMEQRWRQKGQPLQPQNGHPVRSGFRTVPAPANRGGRPKPHVASGPGGEGRPPMDQQPTLQDAHNMRIFQARQQGWEPWVDVNGRQYWHHRDNAVSIWELPNCVVQAEVEEDEEALHRRRRQDEEERKRLEEAQEAAGAEAEDEDRKWREKLKTSKVEIERVTDRVDTLFDDAGMAVSQLERSSMTLHSDSKIGEADEKVNELDMTRKRQLHRIELLREDFKKTSAASENTQRLWADAVNEIETERRFNDKDRIDLGVRMRTIKEHFERLAVEELRRNDAADMRAASNLAASYGQQYEFEVPPLPAGKLPSPDIWVCGKCDQDNDWDTPQCSRCHTNKGEGRLQNTQWRCSTCSTGNPPMKTKCQQCQAPFTKARPKLYKLQLLLEEGTEEKGQLEAEEERPRARGPSPERATPMTRPPAVTWRMAPPDKRILTQWQRNREVNISKALSCILRHKALELKIPIRRDGYAKLSQILDTKQMRIWGTTESEIDDVVRYNEKQRFDLIVEAGVKMIRCNQGQSGEVARAIDDDQLLERLELGNLWSNLPEKCVHGTYYSCLDSILEEGLLPGGKDSQDGSRGHVHFIPKDHTDRTVTSGMRTNSEVALYVDFKEAMKAGIPFYRSKNDVILSPGDSHGRIPPHFIYNVIDIRTGENIRQLDLTGRPPQTLPQPSARGVTSDVHVASGPGTEERAPTEASAASASSSSSSSTRFPSSTTAPEAKAAAPARGPVKCLDTGDKAPALRDQPLFPFIRTAQNQAGFRTASIHGLQGTSTKAVEKMVLSMIGKERLFANIGKDKRAIIWKHAGCPTDRRIEEYVKASRSRKGFDPNTHLEIVLVRDTKGTTDYIQRSEVNQHEIRAKDRRIKNNAMTETETPVRFVPSGNHNYLFGELKKGLGTVDRLAVPVQHTGCEVPEDTVVGAGSLHQLVLEFHRSFSQTGTNRVYIESNAMVYDERGVAEFLRNFLEDAKPADQMEDVEVVKTDPNDERSMAQLQQARAAEHDYAHRASHKETLRLDTALGYFCTDPDIRTQVVRGLGLGLQPSKKIGVVAAKPPPPGQPAHLPPTPHLITKARPNRPQPQQPQIMVKQKPTTPPPPSTGQPIVKQRPKEPPPHITKAQPAHPKPPPPQTLPQTSARGVTSDVHVASGPGTEERAPTAPWATPPQPLATPPQPQPTQPKPQNRWNTKTAATQSQDDISDRLQAARQAGPQANRTTLDIPDKYVERSKANCKPKPMPGRKKQKNQAATVEDKEEEKPA